MQNDTTFLNVLRAVAAFWVLVMHCFIWGGANLLKLPDPKDAVDLFMVVSGFLMVYTQDRKHLSPASFIGRRFLRIAPSYYLSLAVLLLVWPLHAGGYETFRALSPERWAADVTYDPKTMTLDLPNMLMHVSFLFGLHPNYAFSIMLPDWSLSLEMQFYLVFPLLYLLLRKRSAMLSFALGLASIGLTVMYRKAGLPPFPEPSFLPFKLPVFLVGMLIYEAGRAGFRPLPLLGAAALLFLEARYGQPQFSLLLATLLGAMVICWLTPIPDRALRLMKSKFVSRASDWSYAVYLFHGFVLSIVGSRVLVAALALGWTKPAAVAVMTIVVIALTYGLSAIIFTFVEQPLSQASKLLTRQRSTVSH